MERLARSSISLCLESILLLSCLSSLDAMLTSLAQIAEHVVVQVIEMKRDTTTAARQVAKYATIIGMVQTVRPTAWHKIKQAGTTNVTKSMVPKFAEMDGTGKIVLCFVMQETIHKVTTHVMLRLELKSAIQTGMGQAVTLAVFQKVIRSMDTTIAITKREAKFVKRVGTVRIARKKEAKCLPFRITQNLSPQRLLSKPLHKWNF